MLADQGCHEAHGNRQEGDPFVHRAREPVVVAGQNVFRHEYERMDEEPCNAEEGQRNDEDATDVGWLVGSKYHRASGRLRFEGLKVKKSHSSKAV